LRSGIITLLTDFGSSDYFVGAMKGVVLSRFRHACLVDITHQIPRHDLHEAAFILDAAFRYFPAGTVHLAVVDPGVGSDRRPVVVESENHLFVGPDNGIFSLVLNKDRQARITHITNSAYFLPQVSPTFHGRDLFAPVAAALADGIVPARVGPVIQNPICFELGRNRITAEGGLAGSIIHIDHFGNCVTSFRSDELDFDGGRQTFSISVKGVSIRKLFRFYQEAKADPHEPFLIAGSAGYLEISVFQSFAARELNLTVGETILLTPNQLF